MQPCVRPIQTTKKTLLTSDGEEPEHVPHIIRREFYLMDLVMSGLSLRDWRRVCACWVVLCKRCSCKVRACLCMRRV